MIRPAIPDDLPRLVEMGEAMHAESRYRALRFDSDKVRALLGNLMQTGFLMVAERDGRVIGGFAGMAAPHWFSGDKIASDLALFIEPESRGRLDVVRLINAFMEWARAQGVVAIDIGVNTGVHTNQTGRLYEKLGGHLAGLLYSFEGS